MTTAATVDVKITASGASVAIREVGSVGDAVDKAGKQSKGASRGVDTFQKSLGSLAGSLGLATSLAAVSVQAVRLVKESVTLSGQAQINALALETLSGSSMTAAENLQAVRIATRNTVSEFDSARIASKLLSTGMADDSEQIEDFTHAAAILGKTFRGLDAGASVDLFAQMISNRSVKLLDDFGIGINAVNAKMAEMGTSGQEGFQEAVIALAIERADDLGGVLDTLPAKMDRLKAAWTDFKVELGEGLAPEGGAFEALIENAAVALEGAAGGAGNDFDVDWGEIMGWEEAAAQGASFSEMQDAISDRMAAAIPTYGQVEGALHNVLEAVTEFNVVTQRQAETLSDVRGIIESIPPEAGLLGKTLAVYASTASDAGGETEYLEGALKKVNTQIDNLTFENNIQEVDGFADSLANLTERQQALLDRQGELGGGDSPELVGTRTMDFFDPATAAAVGDAWIGAISGVNVPLDVMNDMIDQSRLKYGLATQEILDQEAAIATIVDQLDPSNMGAGFTALGSMAFDTIIAGSAGVGSAVQSLTEQLTTGAISASTYEQSLFSIQGGADAGTVATQALGTELQNIQAETGNTIEAIQQMYAQQQSADAAGGITPEFPVAELEAWADMVEAAPSEILTEVTLNNDAAIGQLETQLDLLGQVASTYTGTAALRDNATAAAGRILTALQALERTFTATVVVNQVGGVDADARALGGNVTEGDPYWVGERGTELFVPNESGTIIPNNALGGIGGGGSAMGGNTTNYNTFNVSGMTLQDLKREAEMLGVNLGF